jgi:hypothetical protein
MKTDANKANPNMTFLKPAKTELQKDFGGTCSVQTKPKYLTFKFQSHTLLVNEDHVRWHEATLLQEKKVDFILQSDFHVGS